MQVYLVNIALIFIWAVLLLEIKPNDKKKFAYCFIVCLQWVLISGLRHISVGDDTSAYGHAFNRVKTMQWSTVFKNIWDYILGADIKDPGYTLLQKIFQIFIGDYQVFLIFIAIIFTVSMAIWIYRNSAMPCLSYVIYSTMFFSFFAVTGHRQTIATALVVFIGYNFIKERKLVPYVILCIIAFFIHKSTLLFAPFYFFAYKKITAKYVGVFAAVNALTLLMGRRLYSPIVSLLSYDYYSENMETNTPYVYIAFITIVSLATFIFYKKIRENRPDDYTIMYNAMLFTLAFTLLTLREQAFMRIQQYYALFLMLIVPEILKCFEKNTRIIPYIVVNAMFIVRMISSHAYYKFFWQ